MCAWKERTEMSRLSIATWTEIGVFVPRPPTHTEKWQKQTVMNSLFFCFVLFLLPQMAAVSDETRTMVFSLTDFVLPPHKCDSSDSASGWIHTNARCLKPSLASLSLSLSGFGKPVCVCVCVHYQANPSPLSAECFSKVYSTARQAGQRKDSILLPLLTHGKSAALPRALVSVVLLSRATDRGHKMGLEGTQHRALTFLIATVEATVTGMVKKREAVFTTFAVLSASFFHEANSLRTW